MKEIGNEPKQYLDSYDLQGPDFTRSVATSVVKKNKINSDRGKVINVRLEYGVDLVCKIHTS